MVFGCYGKVFIDEIDRTQYDTDKGYCLMSSYIDIH